MAQYVQGIQDVIDTAVNIEFNRSKLVAQTVSRSGRISTASRNWANPYRFTVTPKPVWEYADARTMLELIYNNDRYITSLIYFGDYPNSQTTIINPTFTGYISGQILTVSTISAGQIRVGDIISGTGVTPGTRIDAKISGFAVGSIWLLSISQTVGSVGSPVSMTGDTTTLGNPGQDWISKYRGTQDTDNNNYVIDNYSTFDVSGTRMILQQQTGETAPANDFIIRSNDFIRVSNDLYPYQASRSIPVPIAVTGVTGTITSTDPVTTITGLSTVVGLSSGQVLTVTGGYSKTYASGGAPGAFTVTLNNVTSLTIGMRIYGTGLATGATITNIVGNQLTLNTAFTIQATGTYTVGGDVGGYAYIQTIDSASQITIVSDSANTAGAITFNGDGKTTANHKVAIQLNRGYLGAGQPANTQLFVGAGAARFQVKVTKLPTYRFINKDLIEFTSDFELIEEIL